MFTSEEFHDQQEALGDESACAPPLDKVSAQSPRGRGTLKGERESVGLSLSPPSEVVLRRFYSAWEKSGAPDEAIRKMGSLLAQKLKTQGATFFNESSSPEETAEEERLRIEARNVALGTAFFHLIPLMISRPKEPWDLKALKREFRRIVGDPPSTANVLRHKVHDRHRAGGKPMLATRPARYLYRRARPDPLEQFAKDDEEGYYDEPFADLEETLTMQRCMALLSSKEKVALVRMLAHEPPVHNAESLARQRAKRKLRFYLNARHTTTKGTDIDMSAANTIIAHVDQRFDRIERLEMMRAEAIDNVRQTVEKLAQRFPNDERIQDATEQFLDEN
jgi:hypothetical protein